MGLGYLCQEPTTYIDYAGITGSSGVYFAPANICPEVPDFQFDGNISKRWDRIV